MNRLATRRDFISRIGLATIGAIGLSLVGNGPAAADEGEFYAD